MLKSKFNYYDFVKVVLLSGFLYLSSIALFGVVLGLIPGSLEFLDQVHPSVSFIIEYAIQIIVIFVPLWFFIIRKYKTKAKDFGFKKIKPSRLAINTILGYLAYFFIAAFISLLLTANEVQVPGYEAQESYVPFFGTDVLGISTAIFFIVIVAPFIEEIFFRGFIYRTFLTNWPTWFASIMTAIIFSLIHMQPGSFFPIFILALFLNYSYHRTGSLWTSIAFHSLNNAIAFGFQLLIYFEPDLLRNLEATTGLLYN